MNEFQVQTFGTNGPLVFFLHGWPDTGSLFAAQVEPLSKDHRCVVLTNPLSGHTKQRVLGPSFPELYRGFEAVVEKHRKGDERIQLVRG
jgi:pimeloyl-ACP methyl ester carboxylesterase